ncbi:MAG: hypothetical protein IPK19_31405 [Chloroflexi bacterium]|nr:hypothetical protein [Chloroflexota bacterium]
MNLKDPPRPAAPLLPDRLHACRGEIPAQHVDPRRGRQSCQSRALEFGGHLLHVGADDRAVYSADMNQRAHL